MEEAYRPPPINAPACAIVLAAGSGTRARANEEGPTTAKQFVQLEGRPLVAWSLSTLARHTAIGVVVLVLPGDGDADSNERWAEHFRSCVEPHAIYLTAMGGDTRHESTLAGLEAWAATDQFADSAPLFVHDGARPFVSTALIDRLMEGLNRASGAIPYLPVTDTLKTRKGTHLCKGPDRSALVTVQTPQAFFGSDLLLAHRSVENAGIDIPFTDDASIMEWAGHTCVGVEGDADNIKITTPRDWERARSIIGAKENKVLEPRVGLGYDVHRLVAGDGVWLCGHFIEHTHRLDGHSDADVGIHALTDALLGSIGEGDIGTHFPPTDPMWKGAASRQFLEHAAGLVRARGGKIVNVDVAIVAEQPKIGPHRPAMTGVLADALGISASRVSVKATTNERMGFTGRQEGIAAYATASVLIPADD